MSFYIPNSNTYISPCFFSRNFDFFSIPLFSVPLFSHKLWYTKEMISTISLKKLKYNHNNSKDGFIKTWTAFTVFIDIPHLTLHWQTSICIPIEWQPGIMSQIVMSPSCLLSTAQDCALWESVHGRCSFICLSVPLGGYIRDYGYALVQIHKCMYMFVIINVDMVCIDICVHVFACNQNRNVQMQEHVKMFFLLDIYWNYYCYYYCCYCC